MTELARASLYLAIEPQLCGPFSVGTVAVIRLLQRHLELPLGHACGAVNRAVWDGETVLLTAPSFEAARALIRALEALPAEPRVRAWLAPPG